MFFRSYAPEIKIYAIQILPNGQSEDLIWNSLGYSISCKSFKRSMDLLEQTKCVVRNPETY